MKIERILFNSFFIIIIITMFTATSLAFFYLKGAIEHEINTNLERDASLLMEEIDMLIFERLQNIRSLTELDIIQEPLLDNETTKQSVFLSNFKSGYKGVYTDLHIVDANNRVTASSSPEYINTLYPPNPNAYRPDFPNGTILIPTPAEAKAEQNKGILIRIPIHNPHFSGNVRYLYAQFDFRYLHRLLDKASTSVVGDRHIVVIDGEGNLLSASLAVRQLPLSNTENFKDWRPKNLQGTFTRIGQPIINAPVVISEANSEGYLGYAPLGWSVLLIQRTSEAYLYVNTLWFLFIAIALVTFILAFTASHIISKRIARPIQALTQWVKCNLSFTGEAQLFVEKTNAAEIHDLGVAFNQMLQQLESSREHCIKASKLAVIGEMSAIMAHEVRTPLGIMTSAAQYLQREVALNTEDHEVTQIILDESVRLNKLVTSMLDCARPREPNLSPQLLHTLLENVIVLLKSKAEQKHQNLSVHFLPYNPTILADSDLLMQAFLNLIMNAIQITPDLGVIQITTRSEPSGISIEIADNGPGIKPNDFQSLFDPFFTQRDGGIGLGLTVTQQIISVHQGTIAAKNNAWGGASFTIVLPLSDTGIQ